MSDRSLTNLLTLIASFLVGSVGLATLGSCSPDRADGVEAAPSGVPEVAATPEPAPVATPGWSAMAQQSIAASEYAPVADGDGGERFQASNRKQDLRLHFGNGVAVTKRNGEGEVVFTLRAWGREEGLEQAETVSPEEGPCLRGGAVDAFGECLHRMDYARPGLTEWWENRPEGLEQGFAVTAAPEGDGALVFEVEVSGGTLEVEGDEAMIRRTSGDPLRYAGLVVTDATGRELPSWLEEMDGGVRIVVEDEGAIGTLTVDPVITTAGWTGESDQAGAAFGMSVASAGDVNGDGYGDVIVGAYGYDNGETDEGRAYVYLGSAAGLSGTAAWTAESDEAGAYFGWSVASAGDVNGDGYGDVVVGASCYDTGDQGRAYVYLGSPSGPATAAAWTVESDQATAYFGWSVASAGDVNGDGYGDVLVGAYLYSNGSAYEGRAYAFLGSSAGLATTAAWTAESDQASAAFGRSVASAGDVNGDGYDDVVVGADYYDNGSSDEGRAYVYLGSASGLATSAAWTAESDQSGARFGCAVASAGDVNGDGYGDLIVGAYYYSNGSGNEGRAYVYLGSATGPGTSAAWTAESDQDSAHFGQSVASAGDINGDGFGDVIAGTPDYDNGSTNEGRASVYLGSSGGLATSAAWTAESDQTGAESGWSVASAGDVNGDGYADVLVGASGYDHGETDEGLAYLYLGSSSGLATSTAWSAESNQAEASFGAAVASAGDVNGDGYADVVVGAYRYDNGQSSEGRAFGYLGSSAGLASTASWTAESDMTDARFGWSIAAAGDVNGDGYGDVVVGAIDYTNGSTGEGRAYMYLGSAAGLASVPSWTAESDQYEAAFGCAVAGAGDVNGDGYGDIVVGAMEYDNGASNEGMAHVYLGSASGLSSSAGWTAESDQAGAYFGISVDGAGDVNGDGFADVVVGAFSYDNGSADEGLASVYLGSATGLASSAVWTAESNQSSSDFAYSVASGGDVNGDGYDDVIIGARAYDNGSTDEGRAFIYLGSAAGPSAAADWTAESDQASAYFGESVASAGDVNGDGFGDVVVGAFFYNNGESYEGRGYVYLGSSGGLAASAAWTAEANQSNAFFGSSVASAGDVNGDGYGDVVVGAQTYSNGSTEEGRAFLYYGNGGDNTGLGLPLTPQARQPASTIPISPGLSSTSPDTFDASLLNARGPWGRSQIKVQVEAKPLGTPFDGTNLQTQATYVDSGFTGASIQQAVTGLTGSTGYHWRARVLVSPAQGQPQGWGPWKYGGLSGNSVGGHVFTAGSTFYADADGDGYGDSAASVISRETSLSGYVTNATDCDDTSVAINPAASEVCDASNTDEDCNGLADNDDSAASWMSVFYVDSDGDGYGSGSTTSATFCDQPSGYVADATDCDDASAAINPAATEICDAASTDEDCDGLADDDDSSTSASSKTTWYVDSDSDGYGSAASASFCDVPTSGYASSSTDCDDASAVISPAATEVCDASNTDEDCDGLADNNDSSSADSGKTAWYTDIDGDGYGSSTSALYCDAPSGTASAGSDCNDTNVAVHPGATEICDASNTDEDCDGLADDSDPSVSATTMTTFYVDADSDGYGSATSADSCDLPPGYASISADCDDAVATTNPGATDIVGDGVDNDCGGSETCYVDADDDGYRPDETSTVASSDGDCSDAGEALASDPTGDCDDADPDYHPGAAEDDCTDPNDYNCDGSTGVVDADADGFAACEDCDDLDAGINPDATDVDADGIDQDCDGTEICAVDDDSDGYRPDATSTVLSADPDCNDAGEALSSAPVGDCDDADAASNPGAVDYTGDGMDSDCDGSEVCYVDDDGDGFRPDATSIVASSDSDCADLGEALATAGTDDCDDANSAVFPGATDSNGDGIDGDCDGAEFCFVDNDDDGYRPDATSTVESVDSDCDDPGEALATDATGDCDDGDPAFHPDALEDDCTDPNDYNCDNSWGYADADADGFAACADCNDTDATVNADAPEIPGDATDSNCDGSEVCYVDADDDGYTDDDPATVASADVDCSDLGEALSSDPAGDCDDSSTAFHPGAPETDCTDASDYNCDGATGAADGDADGFAACEDCDDLDATINPDASEICDEVDNDCDGTTDQSAVDAPTWYADADNDGYTDPDAELTDCVAPNGYAEATDDDCNDADAGSYPGAEDVPGDGIDQDCDGSDAVLPDTGEADDTGIDTSTDDTGATKPKGCGCATGGSDGAGWMVGSVGIVLLRRRRARAAGNGT